jgi:hypothetical protein
MTTETNTRFWDQLAATDRRYVKPIQGKRYSGSNIRSEYRMKKMTEAFGPVGEGWGWVIDERWREDFPIVVRDAKGAERTDSRPFVFVQLHVWWRTDGEKHVVGSQIGGTAIDGNDADDAYKKAITDALGKCLATLGVCADVYLGEHDRPERERRGPASGQRPTPKAQTGPTVGRPSAHNSNVSKTAWPAPTEAPVDERYVRDIKQKLAACRTPGCVSKLRRAPEDALTAGKIGHATHAAVLPLFRPRYDELQAAEQDGAVPPSDGPRLERDDSVHDDPEGEVDRQFVKGFRLLIDQCERVGAVNAARKRLRSQALSPATIAACEQICDAAVDALNRQTWIKRVERDAVIA